MRSLFTNLARLFTVKPTSIGWRGRGYELDTWEQFILQRASEKDRKAVHGSWQYWRDHFGRWKGF